MRQFVFWTLVCSGVILSLKVRAQDKLCLASEIRQVKVTDLSASTVKYVSADNPSQSTDIPLAQVLILFNAQGGYLVPSLLDAGSTQGRSALNRFLASAAQERSTDELIGKDHKVLDVNISNEDDTYIYWDNNRMAKTDLAAIIYNNGTPKFFCSMIDAAVILGTSHTSPLNLMNPPGSATIATAQGATTQAASTEKTQAATTPTTKTPASAKPTPAVATTPPPVSKPTQETTATANTDPAEDIISKDSAAQRRIDSMLGGHHIRRDEFSDKCLQKTRRFTSYMVIFCDRKQATPDVDKATEACVDLFVDDNAKVSVSSNDHNEVKAYKIRAYLGRLKLLPYDRVEISWVNIQYIDDLKLDANGLLHGTVSFEQEFKAYKDNELVYSDVTTKSINIVLKTYSNLTDGRVTTGWDVKLADIGVTGTRAL